MARWSAQPRWRGLRSAPECYDFCRKPAAQGAAAVSNALRAQHGIDSARLQSAGVGYLAPAASNRTEAGRALNRRVELVEDK